MKDGDSIVSITVKCPDCKYETNLLTHFDVVIKEKRKMR